MGIDDTCEGEQQRLSALRGYCIAGPPEDPVFDRITDMASRLYRVPLACISLLDETRVWFKSHHGLNIQEIPRAGSPQEIAIQSPSVTIIPDLQRDTRFAPHPVVFGGIPLRFYASAPLTTPEGYRIGALCLADTRPRPGLSQDESKTLQDLAAMTMDELTLRVELARTRDTSASLRQSEARFRALMETASQGIIGVNRSGDIELVNRKAEELFGYTREELLGQSLEMLVPEPLRNKHTGKRATYFEHPRSRPLGIGMEMHARHRDGHEFPVEISLNYLDLGENSVAISFITDITERIRLEQQLRQAQKMEAVGQLAGGVAHDFNNLLTVISGYSQLALDSLPAGERLHEVIQEIVEAANRATTVTQQLLAFSRKQVVQPKRFNLNERLRHLHKILRRLIGEDIRLELVLGENIGEILADPVQIDQVVINLVVNARDAVSGGGRILIETAATDLDQAYVSSHLSAQPGPHIMLAITDSGTGMTAEVQAHIFEPFFTTKEPGKGTGLGLATVYGIIKQAGGSIFVYSEVGRGTTFKILFPYERPGSKPQDMQAELAYPQRGAETILLVEDEEAVRTLVRSMLVERGYNVLESTNGVEALAAIAQSGATIDLLLTDVVMPKLNGPDLVAKVRHICPEVRVLYMSGYTDRTVPLEQDLGASFIAKPFTPNQLGQKIREALAAHQPG